MRFDKETRALIYEAAPHPVTITWPAGADQPQSGRVYWLQSEEDAKEAAEKAKHQREHFPETCADVMAGMHRRFYGKEPPRKRKRRHRSIARPTAGDPRILIIDSEILEAGREAKVVLYEDPDPVHHMRMKAKIPAGANPIEGYQEPTETEPEQIVTVPGPVRRAKEEDALKIEHKASVDMASVLKSEQRLLDQRRKGKSGKLAYAALERAKKRADLASAAEAA